jgi:hypothetical protein
LAVFSQTMKNARLPAAVMPCGAITEFGQGQRTVAVTTPVAVARITTGCGLPAVPAKLACT